MVEHQVGKVNLTKKTGYRTSLLKCSEVLEQLSLLEKDHSGRVSSTRVIRDVLNVSSDELKETLRFLECIGAIKRQKNKCLITNYGKIVLTRIAFTGSASDDF